jgi:hypothetical protein
VLAALFCWAQRTSAQSWIAVGPPGGSVRALAADPARPGRLYLGTADGMLYRSEDGGASWQRLTPGFPLRGYSLDQIEVPAAATWCSWLLASQGRGRRWRGHQAANTFTILRT